MKVCLSGVTREDRLTSLLEAQVKNVVLDFSVAKKLSVSWFEENRDSFECLMLEYDLGSSWSRIKYLWGEPSDRTEKAAQKHGSLESAQEAALCKIDRKVEEFLSFCSNIEHLVDVIWIPYLPIGASNRWKKLLKTFKIGWSIQSFDELEDVLHQYSFIGIPDHLTLEDAKVQMKPHIASLKSFKVKTHRWGKVDKETLLTGLFWSSSSSNWLSGSKYGVTFEYVGNLKLVTYHGSKGKGKAVRNKLKAKCETLGLDHDLLLSDDRMTVDLWNLSQWDAFSAEAARVGGYWIDRETNMKKDQLPVIRSQTKSELAHPGQFGSYLRNCNSCFLSATCPEFEPDSNCKISSTPKVDTPEDVQQLLNRVIQIQGERVLFASMSERIQNAGLNPEVSAEMETLTKLMKDAREITSPVGGDEVMIKAKGSGVISRLFGGYGRAGGGTKPSTSETIIDVSPLESNDD